MTPEQLMMPVLVVDDLPSARKIVTRLLARIGFSTIHEANNGQEALAIAASVLPRLIISDWDMPTMSGIELIKALKAIPALSAVPVIVLTSSAERDEVLTAREAGAADYLAKPVSLKALQQRVEAVLAGVPMSV